MFGIGLLLRGEQTLGLGNVYVPRKKEWVEAAVQGALAVGSTVFGAVSSSGSTKKAEHIQRSTYNKDIANGVRTQYEKAIDTSGGRATISDAIENRDKYAKSSVGRSAVGGATAEEAANDKAKGNEYIKSAYRDYARQDTSKSIAGANMVISANDRHAADMVNNEKTKAANVSKAASDAGNAMATIASGVGSSLSNKAELNGTINNAQSNLQSNSLKDAQMSATEKSAFGVSTPEDEQKKRIQDVMKSYGWSY